MREFFIIPYIQGRISAPRATLNPAKKGKENSFMWAALMLILWGSFLVYRAHQCYLVYQRLKLKTHPLFLNRVMTHYFLPRAVIMGGIYAFACYTVAQLVLKKSSSQPSKAPPPPLSTPPPSLPPSPLSTPLSTPPPTSSTQDLSRGGSDLGDKVELIGNQENAKTPLLEDVLSHLERCKSLIRASQFEQVLPLMYEVENEEDCRSIIFDMIDMDIDKFFVCFSSYECSDDFKVSLIWDEEKEKVNEHRSVRGLINSLHLLGIEDSSKRWHLYNLLRSNKHPLPSPYLLGFSEAECEALLRDDLDQLTSKAAEESESHSIDLCNPWVFIIAGRTEIVCSYIHKFRLRDKSDLFAIALALIEQNPHSLLRNLKLFNLDEEKTKVILVKVAHLGMDLNLEGLAVVDLKLSEEWVANYKGELERSTYLGFNEKTLESCLYPQLDYADYVEQDSSQILRDLIALIQNFAFESLFTRLGINQEDIAELISNLSSLLKTDEATFFKLIQLPHLLFMSPDVSSKNQALALLIKHRRDIAQKKNLFSLSSHLLELLGAQQKIDALTTAILQCIISAKVNKLITLAKQEDPRLEDQRLLSVLLGNESLLKAQESPEDNEGFSIEEFRRMSRRELSAVSIARTLARELTDFEVKYIAKRRKDMSSARQTGEDKTLDFALEDLELRSQLISKGLHITPAMSYKIKGHLKSCQKWVDQHLSQSEVAQQLERPIDKIKFSFGEAVIILRNNHFSFKKTGILAASIKDLLKSDHFNKTT